MLTALRHATLAATLAASPAAAQATHFGFKQITIAGTTDVQATALNDKSTVVGLFTDATGSHGFIQSGTDLTVLPPPNSGCVSSCAAGPVAINAAGDVVGVTYFGQLLGFLWRDGAYVTAGSVNLGTGSNNADVIGINNHGVMFYDSYNDGYHAFAGKPGAAVAILPPGSGPFVAGINNAGTVVGSFNPFPPSAFTAKAGQYQTLFVPGSESTEGYAINDHGQVAGLFQDSQGITHGFVHKAGVFTRFDIPTAPTLATIDAMNQSGRVVGVYTDTVKKGQRVFLFNGTTVSVFGQYPTGDAVGVALNDGGTMLVSDCSLVQGTAVSFRVLCGGAGC